jgi:hypothetical protein
MRLLGSSRGAINGQILAIRKHLEVHLNPKYFCKENKKLLYTKGRFGLPRRLHFAEIQGYFIHFCGLAVGRCRPGIACPLGQAIFHKGIGEDALIPFNGRNLTASRVG